MASGAVVQGRSVLAFIGRVQARLFGMPFAGFYALVLALSLLQNGLWYSPLAEQYLMMAKDITRNPFLTQTAVEWVVDAFLGPALAYFLHMNGSLLAYCALQLGLFLVGFTALVFALRRSRGDFVARSVVIIFFLSPLPHVLFTWLGTPDIITVLLSMTVVLFWERPLWALPLAAVLGANHPEQGAVIVLLLNIFSLVTRPLQKNLAFVLANIGGFVIGASAVQWYLSAHNYDVVFTRLDYVIALGAAPFIKATLSEPLMLLFSLFNLVMLFLVGYFMRGLGRGRVLLAFSACTVLAFVAILPTLDQTRVFAIVSFPLLMLLLISPAYAEMDEASRPFFATVLTTCFVAGLIVPRIVVWNGAVSSSAYAHIISAILGRPGQP